MILKRGSRWQVLIYDPITKKKLYVGSCDSKKEARDLEAAKRLENRTLAKSSGPALTCAEFAEIWLDRFHGAGTRRPALATVRGNRQHLKQFLDVFGKRPLTSIGRSEGLAWAKLQPEGQVKAVAAMFNDAFDEEIVDANPFANRRAPQARGRKDIHPLTEAEVTRLGEIALGQHGFYGPMCKGWILFAGWVGARPGEMWQLDWADVDLNNGKVMLTRVKGRKQREEVVLPAPAVDALRGMNTPQRGRVFLTANGKPITKGNARYYWDPVRKAFQTELKVKDPARWSVLFGSREESKQDLDLYELRHFAGSLLADRGLNEFDIAWQLGNSPEVCRAVYIHPHQDRTMDRVGMAFSSAAEDEALRKLMEETG